MWHLTTNSLLIRRLVSKPINCRDVPHIVYGRQIMNRKQKLHCG